MPLCLACKKTETNNVYRACDECTKRYYIADAMKEERKIILLCCEHGYHPISAEKAKELFTGTTSHWRTRHKMVLLFPDCLTDNSCHLSTLSTTSCAIAFLD